MSFLLTAARVLIGLLVLAIGVLARWDQTSRQDATESALAALEGPVTAGLPTLSAGEVTDRYDGQPVYVQGELMPGAVRDPLTGLEVSGVWMKRRVELEQWEETSDCRTRPGSTTRSCSYSYNRVWSDRLIDSDTFNEPLLQERKYINPDKKPLDEPTFVDRTLDLGDWSVDTANFGRAFSAKTVVPESTIAGATLNDGWHANDAYIYSDSDPTLRLRYEFIEAPTGTVSLIAIADEGLLTLKEELASVPLLTVGTVDAQTILSAAADRVPEPQIHWIFYTFFGLMFLIRPVARLFNGLNDFTYAPIGKRIVSTVGIAAFLTLAVGVLFPA